MKILLIALVVVAAILVTGALVAGPQLRQGLSSFTPEPTGTLVRAEPARIDTLIETVSAPGEIEPHTSVQISAEVSARIEELPYRDGDEVRKGELMCKLDDRDLRAMLVSSRARRDGERFRLRSEQARLDGLRSSLDFGKRELGRMEALFASGDVSNRDRDAAAERVQDLEASVEATTYSISVLESSLASAEADIERAEDGLGNTVILSPMDGVITLLNVEVGEVVTGSTTNPGTVIMTIADLSRMVLKAQVAESDVASISEGQRAKIHINAYPDDVFSGTVRQVALQRSGSPDGTGYFRTEVEIDLRGRRIYSGLVANVDVEIKTHEGLVVPYQSIVAREVDDLPEDIRRDALVDTTKRKTNVVYCMVEGKAKCVPVKPGASDLTHRIVDDGLEPEDVVITGPYKVLESLEHEQSVRTEEESEPDEEEGDEDAETAPDDEETGPAAEEADAAPVEDVAAPNA